MALGFSPLNTKVEGGEIMSDFEIISVVIMIASWRCASNLWFEPSAVFAKRKLGNPRFPTFCFESDQVWSRYQEQEEKVKAKPPSSAAGRRPSITEGESLPQASSLPAVIIARSLLTVNVDITLFSVVSIPLFIAHCVSLSQLFRWASANFAVLNFCLSAIYPKKGQSLYREAE